ncbi:hypothetical protein N7468_004757 [Penicillium chermesinum]|uniref:Calcofluor white hypersensitive protein n=1 Tax=Penicillium chermesinum TaxID=63820 RepID=A0A9W9P920_9EURO|nr:uncharacterized protein N7468_004757 [Penicillium chermesinum]KAJ5240138.1 hypothetical protein N7468_004757 [Penicillium chermesinum]
MAQNRGLYAGVALVGAGAYYFYRAGGDPQVVGDEIRIDAHKAREKLPSTDSAEKKGKEFGKEAGATVDEAVNNARSKFKLDERIPEAAEEGKNKLGELRNEAKDKFNSGVDQVDRTVEQKAAEAKGTLSGWFSGKK